MESSPSPASPVIFVVEPFGGSVRWHNPNLPLVHFDDLALTRGEGVFESLLVRDGKAINFSRHSQRFVDSAKVLGMPAPRLDCWERATEMAIAEYGPQEAKCTWTYSRGRASTGQPTAWVVVQPIPDNIIEQRGSGIKVDVQVREWSVPSRLPAKTLNYAATMASLRMAHEAGFDDVIFLEPETRRVLEGATSTVVTFKGDKVRTPAGDDILPGTTQQALFAYAQQRGYRCKAKELFIEDLLAADSVWLVSSVRLAVRVRRLGEHKLKAPDNVKEIQGLIESAVGTDA